MQEVILFVIHHFENMRMAGDEYRGTLPGYDSAGLGRVSAGISANVHHRQLCIFYFINENLRALQAHIMVIDVAIHCLYHGQLTQIVKNRCRANIAGVPYLATARKKSAALAGKLPWVSLKSPMRVMGYIWLALLEGTNWCLF